MILELDIGNSRIKWRLLDEQTGATSGLAFAQDQAALFSELRKLSAPLMVRISSVRGGAVNDAIEQWVDAQWSLPVHIARVNQAVGGVSHQYADQTRLGVDRWLAMLAAVQVAKTACVIIDSGTAITIDVVDKRGLHLGGYITPGLQLMRNSLEQNTGIRLSKLVSPVSIALGNSTDTAVLNGTLAVQVSLINRVVAETLELDTNTRIFFAGGDAELLAARSNVKEFNIAPSLVLDGLAIACPFPGE